MHLHNVNQTKYRIGNNEAPGLDGIPNIALKTDIQTILELFRDVFDT